MVTIGIAVLCRYMSGHAPLPCQKLRAIDASVCVNKERGCSFPLGQTGCFTNLEGKKKGTIVRVLTTGYRLWTDVKKGRALIHLIDSMDHYAPLPDFFDARDPKLLIAGAKAVKNATFAIRQLCHATSINGKNYDDMTEEKGAMGRRGKPDTFYGVETWKVEYDAKRKVGRDILSDS